jgi:hypothetical protein
MKHQNQTSFITDDQAEHMGADMAIQFMLMMLFQLVSEMADDPRGFRTDVHRELAELVATYKLPLMEVDTERKIRAAAGKILDGIMMRSFEQNGVRRAS